MGTRISVNLSVADEHNAGRSAGATASRRRQRSQLSAMQTLDSSESSAKCGKHKHKQHSNSDESTRALYAAAVVGTIPLLITRGPEDEKAAHEALKQSLSLPLPLSTGFKQQKAGRTRKTSAIGAAAAASRGSTMHVDSVLGSMVRLPISFSIPDLYTASRSTSPTLQESDSRFLSAAEQQSSQDSSQHGSDARHKRSMYRKSRGGKRSPPSHVEQHNLQQHERHSHSDHSHQSEHSCCCHSRADSAFRQDSHDGVDYELELSMRRIVRVDVDQITNLSDHLRGAPADTAEATDRPASAAPTATERQLEAARSPPPKRSQSTVVEPSLLPSELRRAKSKRRVSAHALVADSEPEIAEADERRSVCHAPRCSLLFSECSTRRLINIRSIYE